MIGFQEYHCAFTDPEANELIPPKIVRAKSEKHAVEIFSWTGKAYMNLGDDQCYEVLVNKRFYFATFIFLYVKEIGIRTDPALYVQEQKIRTEPALYIEEREISRDSTFHKLIDLIKKILGLYY